MKGYDFTSMLANEAGIKTAAQSKAEASDSVSKSTPSRKGKKTETNDYERFNFICSTDLVEKARSISRKEGFTIRALMEKAMSDFFDKYEAKNGKIRLLKSKDIEDVL